MLNWMMVSESLIGKILYAAFGLIKYIRAKVWVIMK